MEYPKTLKEAQQLIKQRKSFTTGPLMGDRDIIGHYSVFSYGDWIATHTDLGFIDYTKKKLDTKSVRHLNLVKKAWGKGS